MPIMDDYLMILLLVTAGSSGNIFKSDIRNILEFQRCLLIINLYLTPKEKQSLLAINFHQFLPEKICQMCLSWRLTPVSKPCPPFHLMSMGSKTCCLTSILIKPTVLMEFYHSYILKSCSAEIAPIKQSLNTGELPSDWLTAHICPVFKKGNRSAPSNYRPISLTSSCCKIMEHIIFHSIMDHINTNNILINNQHGFRSGFSCQTQLISLTDDIAYAMDNHYQTDLILLDFSKAFGTVPHRRLLAKLQ